jgi:NAD(P)-dependent dehydrogenase (short-subunit alcohol dehydrogenase family)
VTRRGGKGIAVQCDHTDDAQVEKLFDRIRAAHGRLDLLVNNVWGGYEKGGPPQFWEQPLPWDEMFVRGVRAHLVASRFAVPLMLREKPRRQMTGMCQKCNLCVFAGEAASPGELGFLKHDEDCVARLAAMQAQALIVSTIAWLDGKYLGVYYDVAKASIVRMAWALAQELRPYGIASVALAPGFMRSERVLAEHAKHPFDLSHTESTEYVGRAVVALASDPALMRKSGSALVTGDLASEYGFTDIDGARRPAFRVSS